MTSSDHWQGVFHALPYREIWLIDFEFIARDGERPIPVCLVAHEARSGRRLRLWRDELSPRAPPYPVDAGSLIVTFYGSAELGCHLALGWPMPARHLDLFTEFKARTNDTSPARQPASLLAALAYYGLDGMGADEKKHMRDLVIRGGPWSATERTSILNYCEDDVLALTRLLPAMVSKLDHGPALLRGRYMVSAAAMEWAGVPIDLDLLTSLRARWLSLKRDLIADIDSRYGVFDATTFKQDRFADYLARHDIPWPRTPSGRLSTDEDTFKEMALVYPSLSLLRNLMYSLGQLRLSNLKVGEDGRNRTLLSAFQSKTGRNQPSNTQFIFGPAVWLRGLIKPPPGHGICYIDWNQQEFGIAASLSGDPNMMNAYLTGDPYLEFAKQAHAAPPDATKQTHELVREQFKQCALGVL